MTPEEIISQRFGRYEIPPLNDNQTWTLIDVVTRAGHFGGADKRTLNALERRRLVKRRQHHFHWEWYLTPEGANLGLRLATEAGKVDPETYPEALQRAVRHEEDDSPRTESVNALHKALGKIV